MRLRPWAWPSGRSSPKLFLQARIADCYARRVRRAVLVVGKAPVPGQAKTRLAPPLSPRAAADLYRAFLLDTLHLALSLGWERVSLVHPAGSAPVLRDIVPAGVVLCQQPGSGLGDALSTAFISHLDAGFARVMLLASDSPGLPPDILDAAAVALDAADVCLGPSLDGGYYLLGMSAPHPELFESIDWSTDRVCAQTLARARSAGLRVHLLPTWYDVDTPADLDHLHHELASGRAGHAPRTAAALACLLVRPLG